MSLAKIAKLAGVSESTVSRVINNHPRIAVATTKRVRSVMERIGYVPLHPTRRRGPHSLARVGIHQGQVAIVPLGMTELLLYQPFVSETWAGVREALEERGLATVLTPVTDLDRLPGILDPKQVDGVILQGMAPPVQLQKAFKRLPAVYVYSPFGDKEHQTWFDQIVVDNEMIGRIAADYLLKNNRLHVAYLNPAPGHSKYPIRGRVFMKEIESRGGKAVLLEAGPAEEPRPLTIHSELDQQLVDMLVQRLVELKPMPTGLFVPGDLLTAYVYRSLLKRNMRPGRDILVVSCNNERQLLAGLYPEPATIDIRSRQIGRRAVEQLLLMLANPDQPRGVEVRIAPVLVEPAQSIDATINPLSK